MRNPARQLAFFLENWRNLPSGRSVYFVRELNEQKPGQWRMQVRAVELLGDIDSALDALAASGTNVDHYREYFVEWSRAIFAPDHQWGTAESGVRELFPAHAISMLKATADFLDRNDATVTVTPERKADSIEALDEIFELLRSANLADPVRRYVFELINSCRTVLQEADTLNSVDLFARIHELVGVLTVLTDSLVNEPGAKNFTDHLKSLLSRLVPYSVPVRTGAAALDAAANIQQLTGG